MSDSVQPHDGGDISIRACVCASPEKRAHPFGGRDGVRVDRVDMSRRTTQVARATWLHYFWSDWSSAALIVSEKSQSSLNPSGL
jgi:hypothetical protein